VRKIKAFALAIALSAPAISNAAGVDDATICRTNGDIAALVVRDRDSGKMLYEVQAKITARISDPNLKSAFSGMANMVYTDETYLRKSPDEARIIAYRDCMEAAASQ